MLLCYFFNHNSWHFYLSYVKTNDIFGTMRQNWTRYVCFKRNIWVSKFAPFYLNWTWPWVRCENECHHRILRPKWLTKHVSHDIRAIFSSGDLIWPDLGLDLYLALASYLHGIFIIPSQAFWQGLGLQLTLVWSRQPIRRYESALNFDLTMTRYVKLLG